MSSTLQVYNNLLKKHQPWQAMEDKVKKSDFFLKKVKIKKDFVGDEMSIPFITAGHSNVRAGKLTPIADITRGDGEQGVLLNSELLELWGTIKINEKDIRKHKSAEASFKALFPQKINGLMETMKEQVSVMFLSDGSLAKGISFSTDGTDGKIVVDRVERFQPRQRLDYNDGVTNVSGYIRTVDMELDELTIYDAEEAGSVVNLSVMTAATAVKVYVYDHAQVSYDSLKGMLLPLSQGGKATLHGVNKLTSPILQAHYEDAASWTASTILKNVFDFSRKVKQKGKVQKSSIIVPYKVFNDIVLKAEEAKRYQNGEVEAGIGFDKITIRGAGGSMEVYGVFDLNDTGYIMDWENLYLCSPEMFSTNRELGAEPFERVRTEDGHIYILDICFRGALAIRKASGFGVIDNLDY